MKQTRTALGDVESALTINQSELEPALEALELQMPAGDTARSLLHRDLASSSEEPELINLADRRRQLAALRRAAIRFSQISKSDPGALEQALRNAQEELEAWRSQYDRDIKTALVSVVEYSPHATLGTIDDPGKAVQTAIAFLAEDLNRFEDVVRRLEASNKRLLEIEDAVKHNQSRMAALNAHIAAIAVEAGPLSLLLSELFLHIRGEECPVCGRDYSEVSKETLASHVAKRLTELSDQAERLRALTAERNGFSEELVSLEKERESIENQARREGPALEMQDKAAKIRVLLDRLRGLETAALDGTRLLSAEVRAQREMAEIRDATNEERELRSSLAEHAQFLSVSEPLLIENVDAILDRLEATLSQKGGNWSSCPTPDLRTEVLRYGRRIGNVGPGVISLRTANKGRRLMPIAIRAATAANAGVQKS